MNLIKYVDRYLYQIPIYYQAALSEIIREIDEAFSEACSYVDSSYVDYKDEYLDMLDEIKARIERLLENPRNYWHPDYLIERLDQLKGEIEYIRRTVEELEELED